MTDSLIKPELNFYFGTMGCGKSSFLLQMNFSLREAGFIPWLIKSATDTRSIGTIKSRIGLEEPCYLIDGETSLEAHVPLNTTHILCDEAQFLSNKNVLDFQKLVDQKSISIYCFGLRTSYTGQLFSGSAALFAIADNLIELPLLYRDGKKSIMHIRYINGTPVFDGDPIHVGDIKEDYESVSRSSYFKLKNGDN